LQKKAFNPGHVAFIIHKLPFKIKRFIEENEVEPYNNFIIYSSVRIAFITLLHLKLVY